MSEIKNLEMPIISVCRRLRQEDHEFKVQDQPGLHSKTLSEATKKQRKKEIGHKEITLKKKKKEIILKVSWQI
jgi:hypothetical protein